MASRINIELNGIYDDGDLVLGLGLTQAALATARRRGELRFSRKGNRVLYLGQWIVEWLERDALGNAEPQEAATRELGR